MLILSKRSVAALFGLTAVVFCLASLAAPGTVPVWKVLLRIESQGDYRSESLRARTDGTYSLTIEWTGTIELDDKDFLLVHTANILKDWRIEERETSEEAVRLITEEDTPDKPELKMNYVLNEAGRINFDFAVAGFDVPLGGSEPSFLLVFPAAAESGSKAGTVAYNAAVKTGSNAVFIDEAKMLEGPVEKTFNWTWRRQAWVQLSDSLVFQGSGHKAKVTLKISPQQ